MSSPRRGGAAGGGSENPSKKKGGRIVGTVRPFRVTSRIDPSAFACGDRIASRTPSTGPAGRAASRRRASHVARDSLAKISSRIGASAARFVTRAAFVENRGSAARAGFPRTLSQKTPNCRSVPIARRKPPSDASNARYGSIVAWEFPWRVASRPVTRAEPRDVDERREPGRDEIRLHVRADAVAVARAQRAEDRRQRGPAREDVDERDADLVRRAVRGASDRHQARRPLREEVESRFARLGPDVSRARDRARDEARVPRAKRVHADPALLERARQEVLDEDVGLRRPPSHELLALRRPEIHGGGFLAPVHGEEVRGLPVPRGRLPPARNVAAARVLDLDDARPHVREEHRRDGPREDAREVEDDDAVERRSTHGSGESGGCGNGVESDVSDDAPPD